VAVITNGGNVTKGGLKDGVTTMLDGKRPGDGYTVVTPSGAAYMMDFESGKGVTVSLNTVPMTINGTKSTGFIQDNLTYQFNGSRPPAGTIVHTQGGDYIMTPDGNGKPYVPPPPTQVPTRDGTSLKFISVENTYNGLIRPVSGTVPYNAVTGNNHRSLDVFSPLGTPVYAVASGTIIMARDAVSRKNATPDELFDQYGQIHRFGVGLKLSTPISYNGVTIDYIDFLHLSEIDSYITVGGSVEQGQLIGYVGNDNGEHLHITLGSPINEALWTADTISLFGGTPGQAMYWTAGR